jgi:two-component system, cell cycle response regulator CtrA
MKRKEVSTLPEALDYIDALQNRIEELEDIFGIKSYLPVIKMSGTLLRMAGIICKREVADKTSMWTLLYGDLPECDWPEPKILDVNICKLRKHLNEHGVTINTIWGVGWHVVPEHRSKLKELLGIPGDENVVPIDTEMPSTRQEYFQNYRVNK